LSEESINQQTKQTSKQPRKLTKHNPITQQQQQWKQRHVTALQDIKIIKTCVQNSRTPHQKELQPSTTRSFGHVPIPLFQSWLFSHSLKTQPNHKLKHNNKNHQHSLEKSKQLGSAWQNNKDKDKPTQ